MLKKENKTIIKNCEHSDKQMLIFENILILFSGTSDDLKNLLYNPHLRNLLKEIDTAPNAWKAIKAAMHEPLFLEFADECLKIVEPQTDEDYL